MPTYEYACAKCQHHFEKFQPIADKTLTVCPKELCGMKKWGKGKVKRMISAGGGLIFKGSGFYITDYRSENYKQAAKKESGAASGGESKSGAGGESKSSGGGESKSAGTKTESKPAASSKPAKKSD